MRITFLSCFCLLYSIVGYTQYSEISNNEMLLRKFKAKGINFHDKSVIINYLKKFDNNYNSYYANEFEYNKKIKETENQIDNSIQNIKEDRVYYFDIKGEFGEYDFEKKQFSFNPFPTEREAADKSIYSYIKVSFLKSGESEKDDMSCATFIRDLGFVNAISMEEDIANNFLNTRKYKNSFGYEKVNRDVFLRIYYVINNEMIRITRGSGPWFEDNEYLKAEPISVEVWGDKCRTTTLITKFHPNDNEISLKFKKLRDDFASNKIKPNLYSGYPEINGYKSIIKWSRYNDKCEREEFNLHVNFQNQQNSDQVLLFMILYSNYHYILKPGFSFKFYNKETAVEFPLVVYEAREDFQTSPDINAAWLLVKVTKETLRKIISSKCNSIYLQLNGEPKYPSAATFNKDLWCEKKLRRISVSPEYFDFYLGKTENERLFSILKNGIN